MKKILCFGGEKSSSWLKQNPSSFPESSAKLEWSRCSDISGGKALFINPLVLVRIFCCGIPKSFDVIIFQEPCSDTNC